ncbi:nicotinate phosphoribosyltransferase [Vulcanibacillus modesticaldus]|uniref:Nicotinate phosphoribosyltransferase n=2 Tax=Vulcanibacillus modesticaldus TaxID=337097 RepID=A0A1D2YVL3_9BACI|nr:nicotinate phosphoribosyltransferase [Vulcanibacillus modesticaldus]OEF99754.1 nicotinate phosphoribosyltransferase [Vulcanibacillus modesticaldus]
MEWNKSGNLTLLTDYYQISMMYAHFKNNLLDKKVVFDVFIRKNPCDSGYSLFAGLEQVINYIRNIKFSEEDINYISSIYPYDREFLDFLRGFRFTGDIWSVPEGTVIFPNEPIMKIETNLIEAHLIETAILNIINHQTLIATKAARIVFSADGDPVIDFGLRRAQGPDAGIYGSRAAYIGGVTGTSNVLAGKLFSIPVVGTHAHAYIQSYSSELEAFLAYAEIFPNNAILLVDTYDTLNSGIPNAIKTFKIMKEKYGDQFKNYGIRIDSGDLAYLSKQARKMLDEAGFSDAKIIASNDLDEYIIRDLKLQGAKINSWGVGTKLISSSGCSALGGVYKLAAEIKDGESIPKIKISENPEKVTTPGVKKLIRFYDKINFRAIVDLVMLHDEKIPVKNFIAFDPINVWKKKLVKNFIAKELLIPIFKNGELVYSPPALEEIRKRAKKELSTISEEIKRINNPHVYHVDLSQKLWDLKHELINKERNKHY